MDGCFPLITEVAVYKAIFRCCTVTVTTAGPAVSKTSFASATASDTQALFDLTSLLLVHMCVKDMLPSVPKCAFRESGLSEASEELATDSSQ